MPRIKLPSPRFWLALAAGLAVLALWALLASGPAQAQVSVEADCQPAELGAVTLRELYGLELVRTRADDRGFGVEDWRAETGWAVVLLLTDGRGGQHRCLLVHQLPPRGAKS